MLSSLSSLPKMIALTSFQDFTTASCRTPIPVVGWEGTFWGEEAERGFLAADLVICNADVLFATETIAKSDNKDDLYKEAYDWNDKFDFSYQYWKD